MHLEEGCELKVAVKISLSNAAFAAGKGRVEI